MTLLFGGRKGAYNGSGRRVQCGKGRLNCRDCSDSHLGLGCVRAVPGDAVTLLCAERKRMGHPGDSSRARVISLFLQRGAVGDCNEVFVWGNQVLVAPTAGMVLVIK